MKAVKISVVCILLIALSSCLTSNDAQKNGSSRYIELSMPWLITTGQNTKDFMDICEEFNRMTREKIGVEVKILSISSYTNISNAIMRYEKEGNVLDLRMGRISYGDCIPLDDLLKAHGKEIPEILTPEQLSWGRVDGVQYVLPTKGDNTWSAGLAMRKDILEKYGIDLSELSTLDDIDKLFEFLEGKEPSLKMVAPLSTNNSFFFRFTPWDTINSNGYAFLDPDSGEIRNLYETEEYKNYIKLFRKWYLRGYLPEEMVVQSTSSSKLVKAGRLFSFFCACKPGIEAELHISTGYDISVIPLMEPVVTNSSATKVMWGISKNSEHPVEAMKLLNLLYSDADLINLLTYGIEDTHYSLMAENTVDYPEGVTAETSGYPPNVAWFAPNQSIAYIFKGYPEKLWEDTAVFDGEARRSPVFWFFFDNSAVKAESDAVKAVVDGYSLGLETGILDGDAILPRMHSEMKAAGIDKVLKEMNAQYEMWKRVGKRGYAGG